MWVIFKSIILNIIIINNVITGLINPTFPNNIVCFPERDFCSIDGFIDYTNQQLTLNAFRNLELMGSVIGTVSGGGIAFEVNHPGSLCWGDNTNLKVTPNIKINDRIEIKKEGLLLAEMVIKNGYINNKEIKDNVIKVNGYVDSNINLKNIELRIVNPDLKDTVILRRDVRAIVGAIAPTFTGYLSGMSVLDNNFIATFEFLDITTANIAFNGAFSLSMWETEDASGNPLGITISEFGEIGGPWSLLCPAYANYINTNLQHLIVSNQIIRWDNNIQLLPGADPITGFDIQVIRNQNNNIDSINGFRFSNSINYYDFSNIGILLSDIIEFRIKSSNKLSDPVIIKLNTNLIIIPEIIFTPTPNTNSIINTNEVSLSSNTGQILYTLDNTDPELLNGIIYTESIKITKEVTIKAIAYSYDGKKTNIIVGKYAPIFEVKTYLPPSDLIITRLSNSLQASWTDINNPSINLYKINIYSNNNFISSIESSIKPLVIKNLIEGTIYTFSIMARYDTIWSTESDKSAGVGFPNLVDNIIITSAKWKSTEFRITGTSSMPSVILTLYKANIDNSISVNKLNIQGTNNPISATSSSTPDITNNYVFDIRVKKGQVPPNPNKIYISSSKGGVSTLILV